MLWLLVGDQFRAKKSQGPFTFASDNDYLECRLLKGSEDEAVIQLYSYSPISGLISATIFNKKTQSFDNHTSLPLSLVENTGIAIEVFKYGFHFQETSLLSYLVKSFFKLYFLYYIYRAVKYRVIKSYKWMTTKRPDYLNLRISLLEYAINGKFEGAHASGSGFTFHDVMKHIFGSNYVYIKDYQLHDTNIRFILDSLVNESLLTDIRHQNKYAPALNGLSYLEEYYQNEQKHSDSNKLKWYAIVITLFLGWEHIVALLEYFKMMFGLK
jgi:hypothetical protein